VPRLDPLRALEAEPVVARVVAVERLEQVRHVVALFEDELERYQKDVKSAEKLATEPLGKLPKEADAAEMAAWTVVANVLLNLDGAMTRG